MKTFLKVRNIIIILVLFIAILIFSFIRRESVDLSKTVRYLESINLNDTSYTITIEDIKNHAYKRILAENTNPEKTVRVSHFEATYDFIKNTGILSYSEEDIADVSQTHVTIFESEKQSNYLLNHVAKWYIINPDFINSPIDTLHDMTNSNYYLRGYEFVNGKLLYFEHFKTKSSNVKFYFENEKIVYMKDLSMPKYLLSFDVSDEVSEDLYSIPSNYTLYQDYTKDN